MSCPTAITTREWLDPEHAVERVCLALKCSAGHGKMLFIRECEAGTIETRWRMHYSGTRPHIERQHWAGADVDLKTGRVALANGNGMQGVEVKAADLNSWLAPLSTIPKGKAGPPEQYDWIEAEAFAMQLFETRGDPLDKHDQDTGWRSISDVARATLKHLEKSLGDGNGPDLSTIRGRVTEWLDNFRKRKALQNCA